MYHESENQKNLENAESTNSFDSHIAELERRLESLKTVFNQFFSGEVRVPPDQKRQELERRIRRLSGISARSARQKTVLENLVQKFYLYNNLWLKRMNEMENGMDSWRQSSRKAETVSKAGAPPSGADLQEKPGKPEAEEGVDLRINDDSTFDQLYLLYLRKSGKVAAPLMDKEKLTGTVREKLRSQKLSEARLTLSVENKRLKIKVSRKSK